MKVQPSTAIRQGNPRMRPIHVPDEEYLEMSDRLRGQHPDLSFAEHENLLAHVLHLHPRDARPGVNRRVLMVVFVVALTVIVGLVEAYIALR